MIVHAVSVSRLLDHHQTVCGIPLDQGPTTTGWGRPLQEVCAGVTCKNCEKGMGIRAELNQRVCEAFDVPRDVLG